MAQSENVPSLLDRMSNERLPATVEERRDPTEVIEQRGRETGRRPEDVVGDAIDRRPVQTTDDSTALLKQKHKIKVDGVDTELSFEEMAVKGLLAKFIETAQQFPHLQKKHQELVEKVADKSLEKTRTEETAPEPVQITQAMITKHFTPMLQEYVANGFVEEDFPLAYPALATGFMYTVARLNDAETEVKDLRTKLDNAIAWIAAEVQGRKHKEFVSEFDKSIDAVAARADGDKGEKIFADLKIPEKRAAFVQWLRKEVDPKAEAHTPEIMAQFWMAFIGPDLLKYAKEAAEKTTPKTDKRRAASDGAGARPGTVETPQPKSLLDRMSDERLGAEQ